nr:SDR family NAD(P)-dependent oxidoreductase [Parascardovia denticolens]
MGGKGYYVNVASHEDVKKLVADVVADYGRLDVMVNNAGICRIEPFLEMTDKGLGRHRGHQHQRRLLRDV